MKKRVSILLAVCLLAALFSGCSMIGTPGAEETPELQDTITEHTAFLSDSGETYKEYQIVYYGNDSGILRALVIETHFDHDQYALADLEELDLEEYYPGFNSMPFASKQITDDGDFYTVAVIFKDLDNNDNLHQLDDNGILQVQFVDGAEGITSSSYMDALRGSGAQELAITDADYATLHINYGA